MRRRTLLLTGLSILTSACVPTQSAVNTLYECGTGAVTTVRAQNKTGAPMYALNANVLRDTGPCGAQLLFFDGTHLRHRSATGAAIYQFDGTLLRAVTASGARLLYRDGQTWRAFGPAGAALFHFDGTRLRFRDSSGAIIAFFNRTSPGWAAVAVLEAEGLIPN